LVLVDVPNERQERRRLLLQETKVEHLDLGRTVIIIESFYILTREFSHAVAKGGTTTERDWKKANKKKGTYGSAYGADQ